MDNQMPEFRIPSYIVPYEPHTERSPVMSDSSDRQLSQKDIKLSHFFKCNYQLSCFYTSDDFDHFTRHVNEKHENVTFKCYYCHWDSNNDDFISMKIDDFKTHLLSHSERMYQCNWCLYRGYSERHITLHQSIRHVNQYEAAIRPVNVEIENNNVIPCKILKCVRICQGPQLNENAYFQMFKVETINKNTKLFQCLYCQYVNEDKNRVYLHCAHIHPDYPMAIYKPHDDTQENDITSSGIEHVHDTEFEDALSNISADLDNSNDNNSPVSVQNAQSNPISNDLKVLSDNNNVTENAEKDVAIDVPDNDSYMSAEDTEANVKSKQNSKDSDEFEDILNYSDIILDAVNADDPKTVSNNKTKQITDDSGEVNDNTIKDKDSNDAVGDDASNKCDDIDMSTPITVSNTSSEPNSHSNKRKCNAIEDDSESDDESHGNDMENMENSDTNNSVALENSQSKPISSDSNVLKDNTIIDNTNKDLMKKIDDAKGDDPKNVDPKSYASKGDCPNSDDPNGVDSNSNDQSIQSSSKGTTEESPLTNMVIENNDSETPVHDDSNKNIIKNVKSEFISTLTVEYPIGCLLCQLRFKSKSDYMKHHRTKHSGMAKVKITRRVTNPSLT